MTKRATAIHLTPEEEQTLRKWVKEAGDLQLKADRAKIILLAAQKCSTQQIARTLHKRTAHVSKWRVRFATQGIAGLQDAARSGKPRTYTGTTEARILSQLQQPPPKPHEFWTGPLIARVIGNIGVDYVWRVLRAHGIKLPRQVRKEYETEYILTPRLISPVGVYLGRETGAVLIGEAKSTTQRLSSYWRIPNRYVAGEFGVYSFSLTRLTLQELVRRAIVLLRGGHYDERVPRKFDDFLHEALSQWGTCRVHGLIFGTIPPSVPHLYMHCARSLQEWKNQVRPWLTMFLPNASPGNSESTGGLMAAMEEFISFHPGGKAGAFEWYVRGRSSREIVARF
jgi:transposase